MKINFSTTDCYKGKVCIITGGTKGIGLETAKELLSLGMVVVIGSRESPEFNYKIKKELLEINPDYNLYIWPLDLSSMKSVVTFVEIFNKSNLPLNMLINNAAIMLEPYSLTEDNFEHHFQINYLAHCLLTVLLLPELKKSFCEDETPPKVIFVSSCVHYVADLDIDELPNPVCYSPAKAYFQTKLALVMFAYSLQRHCSVFNIPVSVASLHPGIISSNLYKHVWWFPFVGPYLFKNCKEGAEHVAYVALNPRLKGVYVNNFKEADSSKLSKDPVKQTHLWLQTHSLLKRYLKKEQLLWKDI